MTVVRDKKGQVVDVWVVSKTGWQPDWVKVLFTKNYAQWVDNRLRLLVSGLGSDWYDNSNYIGFGMYQMLEVGDVIDRTNCQVLSPSQFQKDCTMA